MSMDLRNSSGEEFNFSTLGWAYYLNLAANYYDWGKAGTQQPIEWDPAEGPWGGAYDWNAGQIVTAQDALGFATALEAYLASPTKDADAREFAKGFSEAIGFEVTADDEDSEHISAFIKFAKKGAFEIW